MYNPVVDSRRLTFGTSGYFYNRHPLLYDRPTESLWFSDGNTMTAVAGHYKGTSLDRVAHLPVVPWASSRADHPRIRLVIGADRSIRPSRTESTEDVRLRQVSTN